MICLTQPDKKKLFRGKSETELELYLCTGKQKKKRFRREKLHRRLEIYPTFNASQTLTKKKKLHRRLSTSLFLSCHPTFKASQILTKKKKKSFREQVQLQSISVSILPKQRYIRKLYLIWFLIIFLHLYCCLSEFVLLFWWLDAR